MCENIAAIDMLMNCSQCAVDCILIIKVML